MRQENTQTKTLRGQHNMEHKDALEGLLEIKYHTLPKGETRIAAEYIWPDGKNLPIDKDGHPIEDGTLTKMLPNSRSKTKFLTIKNGTPLEEIVPPVWGFDGSSTYQAKGGDSDRVLLPVGVFYDPLENDGTEAVPHILVLSEVWYKDGRPHPSNTRRFLREATKRLAAEKFLFGIEQEYTLMKGGIPFGFLEDFKQNREPAPQGDQYCSVGADKNFGRMMTREHWRACLKAGLKIAGVNSEVLAGQWEYQIGTANPLDTADHLVVARYIMDRIGEKYGIVASLDPKPVEGRNGAGGHINISCEGMRDGTLSFEDVAAHLAEKHIEHIATYGDGIERRLVGAFETSSCERFTWGISDRGKSMRVPWQCALEDADPEKTYVEDRRPDANVDPNRALAIIMETVGSR